MMNNYPYKSHYLISLGLFIASSLVYADNPCSDQNNLLAFIDRPTFEDSACSAPANTVLLETGYQNQKLVGSGTAQNVPEAFLRLGLNKKLEINMGLPNYNTENVLPRRGFGPSTLGMKKELIATKRSVISIEGIMTLPSGSAGFGSRKTGGVINGLYSYNITKEWNISGMLGVSTVSRPSYALGARYWSVNPDLVLTWTRGKISIFSEVYGQSITAPQLGSGFNMDAGIIYLIRKNLSVDFEAAQRIKGVLGGYERYVGSGISFEFS